MKIESRLIFDYLKHSKPLIPIRRPDGSLVRRATNHEVFTLAQKKYVDGVTHKRELIYVQLKVPQMTAMRLLAPLQISPSSHSVSKKRQAKGGKRWVVRLDRADCGFVAETRTIWFAAA
jgi:hypothetical protein